MSNLREQRRAHDRRYAVDHPKPTAATVAHRATPLERAAGMLWVVWLILAVAGSVISAPHTVGTLLGVVDLPTPWRELYALAGFVGVEAAIFGLGIAAALHAHAHHRQPGKAHTVAGALNALAMRLGVRAPFAQRHVPARRAGSGGALVVGLFLAALVFNQVDALRDVFPDLYPHMLRASRAVVGLLGPGLIWIAGHRFAHEAVQAGARGQQDRLSRALAHWHRQRDASWLEASSELAPASPVATPASSTSHVCETCGRDFGTHQALNGHRAHCKAPAAQPENGRVHEP
jgi:hypothetical protein